MDPIPKPNHVLFLCTGNSARSIMAEAIANARHGARLSAASAGSRPERRPNALALEILERHGMPTRTCRSKGMDAVSGRRFDLVITLCDAAATATCPRFDGAPAMVHWPLPDPPAARRPRAMFERVFTWLSEAIDDLAAARRTEIVEVAEKLGRDAACSLTDVPGRDIAT